MFCLYPQSMVYLLFLALFGALSRCPFYCRNTYLYWEYLIPLITVILSHRALLTSDLEKTTPPPPGCELRVTEPQHVEEQKSGGRGEEGLFSRAFQLHWARLHCPSFPNEGCTQRGPSPPAVACKQDHCSLGKMSCGNGQYLRHKLTWGLRVPQRFQFYCSSHADLKTNKNKPTLTLGTVGNTEYRGRSISVWKDQGQKKVWCPLTPCSSQAANFTLCP